MSFNPHLLSGSFTMKSRGIILILTFACIEPYEFESISDTRAIVVEASLTNEVKPHYAKISYTFPLDQSESTPLNGATVWIEDDESIRTDLSEIYPGYYVTDSSFSGTAGKSYILNITTSDGIKLISSRERLIPPTPIDSIYGRYLELPSREKGVFQHGIQFFIDAHNDSDPFSNYRYEYEESYEIKVPLPSAYEWSYDDNKHHLRDTSLETCYSTKRSTTFIVGTTQGLSNNRMSEFPIRYIDETGPELVSRYFLSVWQYSISSSAYEYYKDLNESNLSSGSFFDSQKGTVVGNIQATGSENVRIQGLFEVAGVAESRRFFEPAELFEEEHGYPEGISCRTDSEGRPEKFIVLLEDVGWILLLPAVPGAAFRGVDWRLVNVIDYGVVEPGPYPPYAVVWRGGVGQRAIIAHKTCSDCTEHGELKKPDNWD